jgi:MFS superfamily sulfate permease-like transporter
MAPIASGPVFMFFFLVGIVVSFAGKIKKSWVIELIAFGVQTGCVLAMALTVLADDWCRYYYYKDVNK